MYKDASSIEDIVWSMKLSDLPRSSNRARINDLFNGESPYTPQEQQLNNINTNVNWLDGTRIAHDARQKFAQAFGAPGNFFTVKLDAGPAHKRQEYSEIITAAINRRMKKSLAYRETLRNVFAQVVLHGIGPVTWPNRQSWCPTMHMMGDVLFPSRTLLTMENVPYFAVYRQYTAKELIQKTTGPAVDKGWQMDVVQQCLKWAYDQRGKTMGANEQTYSPEKMAEDMKADVGVYQSDAVPTIDCWDFYYFDDSKKQQKWRRKIVLDTPSLTDVKDYNTAKGDITRGNTKNVLNGRNQCLYDSGERSYGTKLSQLIHHQFADGSVVAPFRYHSVRSIGFLLYAVCHLQNRLRCKLNDAAFENCLQYFRTTSPEATAKLMKLDLVHLAVIPDGVSMVPSSERWKTDTGIIQAVMNLNQSSMADSSSSYSQNFGTERDSNSPEKTATQVAAELNASNAMVGAMLNDAYKYQEFQDVEIARRFCIKNSQDPAARAFRKEVLTSGVPEKFLDVDMWNISHERVIGSGNKQIEIAQTNMLMQNIDRYDPDAQRMILRSFTFAATSDPALTNELVPAQKNQVTDSVHDAQMSAGAMLMGIPMGLKQGVNHEEYAATLIGALQAKVEEIMASGGVSEPSLLAGMEMLAGQTIDGQPVEGNGAANHIAILAQRETSKDLVKKLNDAITQQMNEVRGIAQRTAEQQQQAQPGGNPEAIAKVKAEMLKAEVKAENSRAAHQQKLEQKAEAHELEMANRIRATQVEEAATDLRTAGEIRRDGNRILREESEPAANGA